jgi:hypothetical protein
MPTAARTAAAYHIILRCQIALSAIAASVLSSSTIMTALEPDEYDDPDFNRWAVESGIRGRLYKLGLQYPHSRSLRVDQEGYQYLMAVLRLCRWNYFITDNGGGEITDTHLDVVFNHIGFADVRVWLSNRRDFQLILDSLKAVREQESAPIN